MNKSTPRIAIRVRLPDEDEIAPRHLREETVYRWDRILGTCAAVIVTVAAATWGTNRWLAETAGPAGPQLAAVEQPEADDPAAVVLGLTAPSATNAEPSRQVASAPATTPAPKPAMPESQPLKAPSAPSEDLAVKSAAVEDRMAKVKEPAVAKSDRAVGAKKSEQTSTAFAAPQAVRAQSPLSERARVEVLSDRIARAQLTNRMEQREPTDHAASVIPMNEEGLVTVYFYTELEKLKGKTVYHDWYLGDKRMARVTVRPGSDSVRAYSSKYIDRHMLGKWQVRVQTADGQRLAQSEFEVR